MKLTIASSIITAGFIAFAGAAHAQVIAVPNSSFEDNYYSNAGYSSTGIANWVESNPDLNAYYGTQFNNGQFNNTGTVASPVYGVFTGAQYAFLNVANGGASFLTSAAPVVSSIQANTTYKLTVGIGNHLEPDSVDYGQPGNQTISLLANGVVIPGATFTLANGTLAEGANADYSVSFSTSGLGAIYDNQSLKIQLSTSDAGISRPVQAGFDSVTLDAIAAPEPSTYAMVLASLAFLGVCLRRKATTGN